MASTLETWLKRRPRPSHLRCKTASGETRDVDLGAVRSWAKVAETVLTLETVVLEALGPDKALIRATRLDDDDDGAEADDLDTDPDERAPHSPPSRGARASTNDPETERFRIFTAAVAEAYRHSTTVAFGKYSELVDQVTQRYESQEKTLGHLQAVIQELTENLAEANQTIADLQAQPPPGGPGDPTSLEGLASVFAQGAMMGGNPPPAPPNGAKPNGSHA